MPNDVANTVIITGDSATLRHFWKIATTDVTNPEDHRFLYENLYPLPADQENNWYQWQCDQWGNKWGAYNMSEINVDPENGKIEIYYETAWSISDPFWKKVTSDFKIKVKNYYHDEGSCFCGVSTYEDGMITKEKLFDDIDRYIREFIYYAQKCGRTDFYEDDIGNHDVLP